MTLYRHNYSLNSDSKTRQGWSSLPKDMFSKYQPNLGLESEIRSSQMDLAYGEDEAANGGIRVKHEVHMTTTKNSE